MLVSIVATFAFLATSSAHFILRNSREWEALGGDDEMYLPIRSTKPLGKYDTRSIKNCLSYPITRNPMSATRGQSITLPYKYKDEANHIGMCTATLHDATSGELVESLGQFKDCVANEVAVTVKIPNQTTCQLCTVRVAVVAVHISEELPEFYDSCVDIKIAGDTASMASSNGTNSKMQIRNEENAALDTIVRRNPTQSESSNDGRQASGSSTEGSQPLKTFSKRTRSGRSGRSVQTSVTKISSREQALNNLKIKVSALFSGSKSKVKEINRLFAEAVQYIR